MFANGVGLTVYGSTERPPTPCSLAGPARQPCTPHSPMPRATPSTSMSCRRTPLAARVSPAAAVCCARCTHSLGHPLDPAELFLSSSAHQRQMQKTFPCPCLISQTEITDYNITCVPTSGGALQFVGPGTVVGRVVSPWASARVLICAGTACCLHDACRGQCTADAYPASTCRRCALRCRPTLPARRTQSPPRPSTAPARARPARGASGSPPACECWPAAYGECEGRA